MLTIISTILSSIISAPLKFFQWLYSSGQSAGTATATIQDATNAVASAKAQVSAVSEYLTEARQTPTGLAALETKLSNSKVAF